MKKLYTLPANEKVEDKGLVQYMGRAHPGTVALLGLLEHGIRKHGPITELALPLQGDEAVLEVTYQL